jgi:hypothetical protein
MPSKLWDYTYLKSKQLSAVDIKSSHVYCLLALLKDIAINYFEGIGTHEERLTRCQFSRQIEMIPGLVMHLRRSISIYELNDCFEFNGYIPNNNNYSSERRKLMHSIFRRFTRLQNDSVSKTLCNINKKIQRNKFDASVRLEHFKEFIHSNYYSNLLEPADQTSVPKGKKNRKFHINNPNPCTYKNPTSAACKSNISTSLKIYTTQFNTINYLASSISLCTVNSVDESVGVETQIEWYQQVVKNLSACHFTLKSGDNLKQPATDIPVFRNLFFPSPEEIAEFENMLQGDFYILLMDAIGIPHKIRNQFKRDFFNFLYRRACTRYKGSQPAFREDGTCYEEKIREPVRSAMEALLPSIVHFLDIIKTRPGTLDNRWGYYKHTARAVQSIESQIMLETCANLWKKYHKMFLVTVHDCIKCLPKDVAKVQEELTRTFERYHVSVKCEPKDHKRPSDVNG